MPQSQGIFALNPGSFSHLDERRGSPRPPGTEAEGAITVTFGVWVRGGPVGIFPRAIGCLTAEIIDEVLPGANRTSGTR